MKILAQLSENIAGFRKPCTELGHEWAWWEDGVAAFDAFDINQPDIAFLDHKLLDGPTMKRIGEYEGNLPLVVAQMVGLDLYFHISTDVLPKAFRGVRVPAAVDTESFYEPSQIDPLDCRMAVVADKASELEPLLFPVGKYNIRIFGPLWRNTVQYVGDIQIDQLRNIYNAAQMCYATTAKDAVRIVACGGLAVSLNPDLDALGDGFVVDIDRLKKLLECDCRDNAMLEMQRAAVLPQLTYGNILQQLKDKGLEI